MLDTALCHRDENPEEELKKKSPPILTLTRRILFQAHPCSKDLRVPSPPGSKDLEFHPCHQAINKDLEVHPCHQSINKDLEFHPCHQAINKDLEVHLCHQSINKELEVKSDGHTTAA